MTRYRRNFLMVLTALAGLLVAALLGCEADSPTQPGCALTADITAPNADNCFNVGVSVTFTASFSGASATGTWSVLPAVALANNSGTTMTHAFTEEGTYVVTFTAQEGEECFATDNIRVHIRNPCSGLVAFIEYPEADVEIAEGGTIEFQGQVLGGRAPYTYAWDFGNGTSSTLLDPPAATYPTAGVYTVTFTATDADGLTDGVQRTVTVVGITVDEGVSEAPVEAPDDAVVFGSGWAGLTSPIHVAFAGGNGTAVLNALAGGVVRDLTGAGFPARTGAVPLQEDLRRTAGDPFTDVLIEYGPTGAVALFWDDVADDWAAFAQTIEFSSSVWDVSQYGGSLTGGGALVTTSIQVRFFEWDTGGFQTTGSILSTRFPGASGALLSAYAREESGAFVAISGGSVSQLYVHDRGSGDAVVVGPVGSEARRVRAEGNILAVTAFASDSLFIATWDGSDNVTLTDAVAVGDGPVGVDLIDLMDGTVAAVTTGFNDNTYTITVIDAAGMVVSSSTLAVPAAVLNPAHAVWIGTDRKLLITGFGSDNYAVVATGL